MTISVTVFASRNNYVLPLINGIISYADVNVILLNARVNRYLYPKHALVGARLFLNAKKDSIGILKNGKGYFYIRI